MLLQRIYRNHPPTRSTYIHSPEGTPQGLCRQQQPSPHTDIHRSTQTTNGKFCATPTATTAATAVTTTTKTTAVTTTTKTTAVATTTKTATVATAAITATAIATKTTAAAAATATITPCRR